MHIKLNSILDFTRNKNTTIQFHLAMRERWSLFIRYYGAYQIISANYCAKSLSMNFLRKEKSDLAQ